MKSNALTVVPYNDFGKEIIKEIRKLAKRNGWKVSLRGRNKNRKELAQRAYPNDPRRAHYLHEALRRSIPLKYSDRAAVYVYNKGQYITASVLFELDGSGTLK